MTSISTSLYPALSRTVIPEKAEKQAQSSKREVIKSSLNTYNNLPSTQSYLQSFTGNLRKVIEKSESPSTEAIDAIQLQVISPYIKKANNLLSKEVFTDKGERDGEEDEVITGFDILKYISEEINNEDKANKKIENEYKALAEKEFVIDIFGQKTFNRHAPAIFVEWIKPAKELNLLSDFKSGNCYKNMITELGKILIDCADKESGIIDISKLSKDQKDSIYNELNKIKR